MNRIKKLDSRLDGLFLKFFPRAERLRWLDAPANGGRGPSHGALVIAWLGVILAALLITWRIVE